MPLARIVPPSGKPANYRLAVGDVVSEAMVTALNAPKDDGFQIITEHSKETFVMGPTYLGVDLSPEELIIQLTLNEARSTNVKKAFCRAVAGGLHERLGLRREDVFISLVEVEKENWSFVNGIAQYAEG